MSSSKRRTAVPGPAPRLGLVCTTVGDAVRYRSMTRARLLRLSEAEQRKALAALYGNNLDVLRGVLEFCDREKIRLYRVTSNLFPLCDEPAGTAVLEAMADRLGGIGPLATRLKIRVVDTSNHIMRRHARVFDLLGLPRSSRAALTLHGGKSGRADARSSTICPMTCAPDCPLRTTSGLTPPPRCWKSASAPACRWFSTRTTTCSRKN